MDALVRQLGYVSFSYLELQPLPRVGEPTPFHVTTLRREFYTTYLRENFASYDPILYRAAVSNTPFTWADCPEFCMDGVRRGPKTMARRIIEAAYAYGYTQGLVIPMHAVDKKGELVSSLISLAWGGPTENFGTPATAPRWLRLAAIVFHEQVEELRGPQDDEPLSRTSFTDRELDCMVWAGRGKTIAETAKILKISERTVEFHIQNAMKKLGVHNKVHAVALAIRRGLIAL